MPKSYSYILATLIFSFFVGKNPTQAPYPNPTQLTKQSISAIENLRNLESLNVGIAFNDTGTNMLLGGIVPSKSISMLGPSYYGIMEPMNISKLDMILTSLDFLSSKEFCRSIKSENIGNGLVLVNSSLDNRRCIQSILE